VGQLANIRRRLRRYIFDFDSYRPELHYMRGPGPKWREKHANIPASCRFRVNGRLAEFAIIRQHGRPCDMPLDQRGIDRSVSNRQFVPHNRPWAFVRLSFWSA
jgi:hypothetical protein